MIPTLSTIECMCVHEIKNRDYSLLYRRDVISINNQARLILIIHRLRNPIEGCSKDSVQYPGPGPGAAGYWVRNLYTVLDLAAELGLLEAWQEDVLEVSLIGRSHQYLNVPRCALEYGRQ